MISVPVPLFRCMDTSCAAGSTAVEKNSKYGLMVCAKKPGGNQGGVSLRDFSRNKIPKNVWIS